MKKKKQKKGIFVLNFQQFFLWIHKMKILLRINFSGNKKFPLEKYLTIFCFVFNAMNGTSGMSDFFASNFHQNESDSIFKTEFGIFYNSNQSECFFFIWFTKQTWNAKEVYYLNDTPPQKKITTIKVYKSCKIKNFSENIIKTHSQWDPNQKRNWKSWFI